MESKPSTPTKTEWKEAVDIAQKLIDRGISPVVFETLPFATPKSTSMLIEHAIDTTRGSTSKIVFHFKNISITDMQIIGKALYELVNRINIKTAFATASANPEYRNCWDFIFFEVPSIQAPIIRSQILQTVQDIYRK